MSRHTSLMIGGMCPGSRGLSAQPSKLTNSVVPHGVREGEGQADDAQAIGIEMLGKGEDQPSRDLLPGIQLGVKSLGERASMSPSLGSHGLEGR